MEHTVRLTDEAFREYERRAQPLGLSVEEYLHRTATAEGTLTPEMRAAIEQGLLQADAGLVFSFDQVRETLAQYREGWNRPKSR